MTDNDLDDLKQAMVSQTPTPDAARRAANIAQAQAVFDRVQDNADTKKAGWSAFWGRGFARGGWGLVTTATAVVAVGIIVLPQGDQLPTTETLLAPQPESSAVMDEAFSAEIAATEEVDTMADTTTEGLIAPQALSPTAEAPLSVTSSRALPADPWNAVATALAEGQRPAPDSIDITALINAAISNLPGSAPTQYVVPWTPDVVLLDSGDPDDAMRLQLIADDGSAVQPTGRMQFVVAVAGFASLLASDTDLDGWGIVEALDLAMQAERAAQEQRILDLMRSMAALDGN